MSGRRHDRHELDPNQDALFTLGEVELPEPAPPIIEPEPVAVDITERAKYLGLALKSLNQANMRAGMQEAAATPYRLGFEERYGGALGRVLTGVEANEKDFVIRRASRQFAQAAGMQAMLAAGWPREDVLRMNNEMFTAFRAKYGVGVTVAEVRNKEARRLEVSADIITGKRLPSGRLPRKRK